MDLDYVRRRLRRVVQRANQHVVGSGVANTGVADAPWDVWLDHLIHFRVGDQQDRSVIMLE